jgi:hypothetical protein
MVRGEAVVVVVVVVGTYCSVNNNPNNNNNSNNSWLTIGYSAIGLQNTDDTEADSGSLSVTAIAMLEKSNILALVGNGTNFPRETVVIWDHARNINLANIRFPTPVLNVLMHYS